MMENSARFFEAYWPNMLEDMQAWMRIPSVSREAEGPYPFGRACGEALDAALALGRAMGFDTENDDYTGGSILFRGTQAGEIGMFAHLDVVPEGEGWLHPPYSPYISDGWLYGRGSADDKGPAVVALYAMYCLKQMGYVPCRTIRLYLGCSEERGMRDIRAFLERHPAPDFSFTPDASFSVCYSEKGI
ncbi:MAG: M20/M25/M40 family metallo-hydrolase, partial [Aristaeellaceae bacterium]